MVRFEDIDGNEDNDDCARLKALQKAAILSLNILKMRRVVAAATAATTTAVDGDDAAPFTATTAAASETMCGPEAVVFE